MVRARQRGSVLVLTILGVVMAGCGATSAPLTLYDAGRGTLPTAQGWDVLVVGDPATESLVADTYRLDTSATGVKYYGNARTSPVLLDTARGFDLSFSLQIESEAHTSPDRAGYSVVVIGDDPTHALELSFWTGNIWVPDYDAASADPDHFVHGQDVAFDTASALRSYTLSVREQTFSLSVEGRPLMTGPLHDYTAGGAPYILSDFVFFGDDTSRGLSVTRLGALSITASAVP